MSVLIKGVEMPKNCRECWLKMNCDDCEGWECVCVPMHQQIGYLDDLLADKRRDDCPLVPVPPHGRLGDMDAIARKIRRFGDYVEFTKDEIAGWFENGDFETIIPAEEGE